ncbi:MAG TPA: hypothetical protein VFW11_03000 [Cyclobacteriaceae bacterium]|nr:hypothetical protein [Cyclobacteriaceae bacterium]
MKSPLTTIAIDHIRESGSKFSLGLTLAGIVTAILCSLALVHDASSTGSGRLPDLIESSSISAIDEIITSASTLSTRLGDTVILMTNFYNQ